LSAVRRFQLSNHYRPLRDHLIPLDLAGSPTGPRDLWPEPRYPADGWAADKKDEVEARLVRLVCDRRVS